METKKPLFQTISHHATGRTDEHGAMAGAKLFSSRESDQEETEDEEVKMSCIGGQRGMLDADLSSDDEGNESEAEQEEHPNSR